MRAAESGSNASTPSHAGPSTAPPVPGAIDLGELGPAVLGTMTFGEQTDEVAAARMVGVAREAGVRMFDTANSYVDGRSEELLGGIVAPFRDEVLIATKVGNLEAKGGKGGKGSGGQLSVEVIRSEVEGSLRRLGTDRIDLYYLHRPDWSTPIEETLGVCEELVREGKIRAVGLSNYAAWQSMEALSIAQQEGWSPAVYAQPMYNAITRRLDDEYRSFALRYGIRAIVFNPLAGGLLTGKHTFEAGPAEGTRFGLRSSYQERYWASEYFEAVEALRTIASDAGMGLIELVLRWLDAQPLVHKVLLGASKVEHLEANLRALDGPPPDAASTKRIDEVWQRLRGAAPAYNK